ncbi:MAG: LysM peptidoglycan-binding domain-containing protein [Chloroflexota bacterium]
MRKLLFLALLSFSLLALWSLSGTPVRAQDRLMIARDIDASENRQDATSAPTTVAPRGPTPVDSFIVATVTPYEDGSVIHIVQSGQTLYTIAEAYSITVQTLLDLNRRQLNDKLYVGDKLIVRLANTVTPTPDVTDTSTARPPTATRRPTRTSTALPPTATPSPLPSITPTATPVPQLGTDPVGNVLLSVVVFLLGTGVILVAAGVVIKRRSRPDLPG